jgi:hypothetical protein
VQWREARLMAEVSSERVVEVIEKMVGRDGIEWTPVMVGVGLFLLGLIG